MLSLRAKIRAPKWLFTRVPTLVKTTKVGLFLINKGETPDLGEGVKMVMETKGRAVSLERGLGVKLKLWATVN